MQRQAMRLILILAVIFTVSARGTDRAGGQESPPYVSLADPPDGILNPLIEGPFGLVTLSVNQNAVTDAGGQPVPYLSINAAVAGQPLPFSAASLAQGQPTFIVEPCALPDGSDLPGTPINIDYTVEFPAEEGQDPIPNESGTVRLALGPDTRAPILRVISPSSGDIVTPGDTITIMVAAEEPDNLGDWQTGLHRFELRGPDGQVEERAISTDGPHACADKAREGQAGFSFQVPDDAAPGRSFEFVVEALDWEENRASQPFTLVVEGSDTWTGRLSAYSYATSLGLSGYIAADTAQGSFSFTVGPDGAISGRGTATIMTPSTQVTLEGGTCTFSHVQDPVQFEIEVQGRRNGSTFDLQIHAPGVASRATTAVCTASPEPVTNFTTISRFGFTSMTGGPESGGFTFMLPAADNGAVQVRNTLDLGSGSVDQTAQVEIGPARS